MRIFFKEGLCIRIEARVEENGTVPLRQVQPIPQPFLFITLNDPHCYSCGPELSGSLQHSSNLIGSVNIDVM